MNTLTLPIPCPSPQPIHRGDAADYRRTTLVTGADERTRTRMVMRDLARATNFVRLPHATAARACEALDHYAQGYIFFDRISESTLWDIASMHGHDRWHNPRHRIIFSSNIDPTHAVTLAAHLRSDNVVLPLRETLTGGHPAVRSFSVV